MKKAGVLSFICYLLYLLGGAGLALYSKIMIDDLNANGGGWEGLGHAIVLILGIILAGVGLVGVILKGIHLKTGWGLFGVLCILFDLACVAVLAIAMTSEGEVSSDFLSVLPFAIPSAVALVGNILSLKN